MFLETKHKNGVISVGFLFLVPSRCVASNSPFPPNSCFYVLMVPFPPKKNMTWNIPCCVKMFGEEICTVPFKPGAGLTYTLAYTPQIKSAELEWFVLSCRLFTGCSVIFHYLNLWCCDKYILKCDRDFGNTTESVDWKGLLYHCR